MRFVLYTDKSVAQCLSALKERIQAKRGMEGNVDKGGEFSMAISSKVLRRFTRTTRLRGKMERENNLTVVRGFVPHGVSLRELVMILGAMLVVAFIVLSRGNFLLALAALAAGGAMVIPLVGDHRNSEVLFRELKNVLKAKETPPKKPASPRNASTSGKSSPRQTTRTGSR